MILLLLAHSPHLASGARYEAGEALTCSLTEKPEHLQYGTSFSYAMKEGYGCLKCNVFQFFNTDLKEIINSQMNGDVCSCSADGSLLFDFRPLSGACDVAQCWDQYTMVMKKIKCPPGGCTVSQGLDSFNHWNADCTSGQTTLPSIEAALANATDDFKKVGSTYRLVQHVFEEDAPVEPPLAAEPVDTVEDEEAKCPELAHKWHAGEARVLTGGANEWLP